MAIDWDSRVLPEVDLVGVGTKDLVLIANGDRRRFANLACQEAQTECERQLREALEGLGGNLVRTHPEADPETGHGITETQAQGADTLSRTPKDAPIVTAEAAWQYSDHIAHPLWEWIGPVLIASNSDGTWPGLVGAAGLEACLTKHKYGADQKGHSFVWGHEEFQDKEAKDRLKQWLDTGSTEYDLSHVKPLNPDEHAEYASAIDCARKAAARAVILSGQMSGGRLSPPVAKSQADDRESQSEDKLADRQTQIRPIIMLYSVNAWLAYIIQQIYYNEVHYVWTTDHLDPKSPWYEGITPVSSCPRQIYRTLEESVRSGDRHCSKIQTIEVGILKGAAHKREVGIISKEQEKEIATIVDAAQISDFRPLLYLIPFFPEVARIARKVPVKDRAHPLSVEYVIDLLPRHCFHITELD